MSKYLELFAKAEKDFIPISGLLELTYQCNEQCIHCYIINESEKKELATAEWENILAQLTEIGCMFLSLSGGESLLRKDFWQIASRARQLGFVLRLKTNGTMIDEVTASKIKDFNFFCVDISLYATAAQIHDKITGYPGSFQKTVDSIKLLTSLDVPVQLLTVLMKDNLNELENIIKFARELDTGLLVDPVITPKNDGSLEPLSYRLNADEQVKVYDLLEQKGISALSCPQHGFDSNICSVGRRTFSINPYGNVQPCLQFTEAAGNLRRQSFTEIWNDSPLMQKIRSWKVADLHTCTSCPELDYCFPCPGLANLEGDPLGAYSGQCISAKARHKLLKKNKF